MNPYVLLQPVITEKTLMLAQTQNMFTFQVDRTATKQQIADIVRRIYSVDVTSVNTIFGHRALKASGKRRLKRPQSKIKKAVITLKPGQKIEVFNLPGGATQA